MPSRRLSFLLLVVISVSITPATLAHPMGNFSVNHYSKISLESDGIAIRYIIDLAEIPTYQELQEGNVLANAADPAVAVFLAARGEALGRGLSLVIDGKAVPLHLVSRWALSTMQRIPQELARRVLLFTTPTSTSKDMQDGRRSLFLHPRDT
jgi:hypothetical protein